MSQEFVDPICPRCGSRRDRCIDVGGGLAWPWHIERQLELSRKLLADVTVQWEDDVERQRHVDLLRAYVQGRIDAQAAS